MSAAKGIRRARPLDESEINFLRYGLRLDRDPVVIKRALQSLCQYYEDDRILLEPAEIRQLIHSHLGSDVVLIRRWAIKALGLIKHPEDTARLIDRLRVETDEEAQTWGIAALLASNTRPLAELVEEAGLDSGTALVLAARLYAPEQWIKDHAAGVTVNLGDDELALKWATFLIGYNKAPKGLFSPKYDNDVFLGELNDHPSAEIREYSIWALCERADYDARQLKIGLGDAQKHPKNVRKWLYRLGAQSADIVGLDPDLFEQLRKDTDVSAREGLAIGLADLDSGKFSMPALEWYSLEPDDSVKELLLASMAMMGGRNEDLDDAVIARFEKEPADSPLRRRLLAASTRTPLWRTLKRIEQRDSLAQRGLFEFGGGVNFFEGDQVLGSKISAGGDINANNLVAGNMIASANNAVQSIKNDAETHEALTQVLQYLKDTQGSEAEKTEVAQAVEAIAKNPNQNTKANLLAKLGTYGQRALAIGAAAANFDKIVELVGKIPL